MNEPSVLLPLFAMVLALFALLVSVRLDAGQRKEYEFFLAECPIKTGRPAGWREKISSFNAALGGPAPKWHWIEPVVSSSVGAEYYQSR